MTTPGYMTYRSPETPAQPSPPPRKVIGPVMLATGGVLAAFLVATSAWSGLGQLGATQRTEAATAPGMPAALVLRADCATVRVRANSAVDRPTFTYRVPWPADSATFTQSRAGDTLTAELHADRFLQVGLNLTDAELTVELPATSPVGSLKVETETGSVDVDISAESLELETGTGSVTVRGTTKTLTALTGTGSVLVDAQGVRQLKASTDTGSVTVNLGGTQPSEVTLHTGTGSILATLPAGPYAVRTSVGTGSVVDTLSHDDAAAQKVLASTGTGSIVLRQA